MKIILASGSPRRFELLNALGFDIETVKSDIDEKQLANEPPEVLVERLAREKAGSVNCLIPVVGGDTLVVLDGEILGKPESKQDAFRMLRSLSGKTHEVISGYAVKYSGVTSSGFCKTAVSFRSLTDEEISIYVDSGEPMGKAGAYAVQGHGAALVASVHGSISNVIGLPIEETLLLLRRYG